MTGRFAPSPSGRMHLGNIFSLEMAYLSARSQDGEIVLRIEDLDVERCRPEYAAAVREDLKWLGLTWDREMPQQSTRAVYYSEREEQLRRAGLVYPCWCSRSDWMAASAPHASDGKRIYPGTCRFLTEAEKRKKTGPGALRVAVPDREIFFCDGLQGNCRENLARDCGDFVIRRADGTFAYQLAVVADDIAAGVTEVVRGRDLLDSAPRQIFLYECFGETPPKYYHVPLLMAADGHRLSKRERDMNMGQLRLRHTPEEILGHLAYLAGILDRDEAASLEELTAIFQWSAMRKEDIIL